jgi:D-glycero-D-manno-heptose 1,7-bisphosphate phosphatase
VRRFVFLDRDGTLVRDTGYPHRREDYELLPAIPGALRRLCAAGFGLAIVTNQSGIGRGLFSEADFEAFQRMLLSDLAAAGVTIAATYHCPHAPGEGCACRKPGPGLLLRARDELGASLQESWVVGDAERDVAAAARAGCRGAVRVGAAPGAAPPTERPPRFWDEARLDRAADRILEDTRRPGEPGSPR